jgi:hypothetical protein
MTHSGQIHSHLHVKQKYKISSSICYPQVLFDEIPTISWLPIPDAFTYLTPGRYCESYVRPLTGYTGLIVRCCCGGGISFSSSAIL